MKLGTLIKCLQKIEKENGGDVKVCTRNYNGSYSPLTKLEYKEKYKTLCIDAAQ